MSHKNHLAQLAAGTSRLGVWGLGSIGALSLRRYSEAGHRCIGFDVSAQRVAYLRRASVESTAELQRNAVNPFERFLKAGSLLITDQIQEVLSEDVSVHLICVPTENQGVPTAQYVREVCELVARGPSPRPLVIVESTLTPGSTEQVLLPAVRGSGRMPGEDFFLAISPRRDWIENDPMDYREMHRIMGAIDSMSEEAAAEIIRITSPHLHRAPNVFVAELVKCIENAYRFIDITFANQLAMAFPEVQVNEALRLAGTKWNMGTFYPGLRPAGHCIPVAARHLLHATSASHNLTLISAGIDYETAVSERVADIIHGRGMKRLLILGYSYQANVRVPLNSPAPDLIRYLQQHDIRCDIVDPFFTLEELKVLCSANPVALSNQLLVHHDCILVVAAHDEFSTSTMRRQVRETATDLKLVLDTTGLWRNVELPQGAEYMAIGDGRLLASAT